MILALFAIAQLGTATSTAATWTDSSRHQVSFVETAPGVRLEVLDWGGSGPPLIFIPGLGNTAHAFDSFAPRFTDHYHVLAMTRRGFGASSHPDSGYDAETLTEDLVHILDAKHLDKAVLAGHSIARIELTGMGARHPDRLRQLIYLDAGYDLPGEDSVGQRIFGPPLPGLPAPVVPGADASSVDTYIGFVHRSRGVNIPESDIRARYASDGWSEDLGKGFQAILQAYVPPDYARVRVPVLAIYARQDSISQEEPWIQADTAAYPATRELERRTLEYTRFVYGQMPRVVPSARIAVIPGGHHWIFVSHADRVERLIREFLN